METYEIVIEYTDPEKFKEGMHDIRRQLWHIKSQIKSLEGYHNQLVDMRKDAINIYCDPDDESCVSKVWIPKHIAKVD